LVQGYVHDLGAAVLGGIGGHAGLFGNANDLAMFFQMLLQKGTYAGVKYFEPETIEKFTTPPFPGTNRRALGFDTSNGGGPACSLASNESFGHTGFTGCMVWADPKYDFVYVFLSNRVYPVAENDKINELLVRTKVQSLFYQSFLQFAK
jgi:CubicO group peptidase (beta-lactamase class C family)